MENGWKGDAYHVQDTVTLECVFFFFSKESFELSWTTRNPGNKDNTGTTSFIFQQRIFTDFRKRLTFYQKKNNLYGTVIFQIPYGYPTFS